MFALSGDDLRLTILGCGDGPASFNAEATRQGIAVTSCDPIYRFDDTHIRQRIVETYQQVMVQTRRNSHEFVWNSIHSVDELGKIRMKAMDTFLADYPGGKSDGRYVEAELPKLPFTDRSFGIALCSHFLFLYGAQLGEDFHRESIFELCRVAREVRIFPLLALGGQRSQHIDRCAADAREFGHEVLIENVSYEFQRGGNQMMRIRTSGTKDG